jgi:hypothetical protein
MIRRIDWRPRHSAFRIPNSAFRIPHSDFRIPHFSRGYAALPPSPYIDSRIISMLGQHVPRLNDGRLLSTIEP